MKQVWQIFDGIGETKHNPGDCDKTALMLVDKCKQHNMSEVVETEFVKVCSQDAELGTVVVKIYRAFIGCWSFMYERWESGVFFTQTKPPGGWILNYKPITKQKSKPKQTELQNQILDTKIF